MLSKIVLTCAVVAATAVFSGSADAVTYDLTLTPTSGTQGGTGVLTLSAPINPTTFVILTPGPSVTNAMFTVAGTNFNVTSTFTAIEFSNGTLFDIGPLTSNIGSGLTLKSLSANGTTYTFFDASNHSSSIGTISAQLQTTPLPPAWTMMLLGLIGFGFFAYRRGAENRSANFAAA